MTEVRGAYDAWLSGAALLVLAVLGLWIRRKFEARDEGPREPVPPAPPVRRSEPRAHGDDESDDEDRTPA